MSSGLGTSYTCQSSSDVKKRREKSFKVIWVEYNLHKEGMRAVGLIWIEIEFEENTRATTYPSEEEIDVCQQCQ